MPRHDNTPVDPREGELVEAMILDSMEYIHGKGSKDIVKLLGESDNTSQTMATIAYKVVRGVAEKNKATAQVEMDMDMLMGVATEAIDMITEVAQSANEIGAGPEVERLKEDTLLKMTVMHGEQLGEINPEQRQAAATDLRDYMSDGGTQKAFDYINTRAKEEGLNPNDMMRAGNEAATGYKNPIRDKLAEGISRGLMGQPVEDAPATTVNDQPVPGPAEAPGQQPPAGGLMAAQTAPPPAQQLAPPPVPAQPPAQPAQPLGQPTQAPVARA